MVGTKVALVRSEAPRSFIPVSDIDLGGRERQYLLQAFDSGWISGSGPFVELFEKGFADFCGTRHALSCANGTVALHLALLAMGVGPGDEVIVPSLTYIATANAVSYCGATPVFADADPETWNAEAAQIAPLITPRTRGIVAVHLYGNPVDMDPLMALAREHGLFVIEDAAEAHGATYCGRKLGSIGDIAAFSFYGNKMMTTGEGGMVTTDDAALAERMRLLRGQGMDPKRRYWFPLIGHNYRLTNLQCAIGLAQLERVEAFIAARRRVAAWYREAFDGVSGLRFQQSRPPCEHAWWMTCIQLADASRRDAVAEALAAEGIETRPVFYPLHGLPPYAGANADCPNAETIGLAGLSLPSGGHVGLADVERIAGITERAIA